MILKGPYLLGASLVAWYGRQRFFPSSQTWSLVLYCADGVPDCSAIWFRAAIAWACLSSIRPILSSIVSLTDMVVIAGFSLRLYPRII